MVNGGQGFSQINPTRMVLPVRAEAFFSFNW